MVTYKERKENLHSFVLLENSEPLGTFGNLKKVVEFLKYRDCPSYWTLIRKTEYPISFGKYNIYKVKHY